MTRAPRIPEFIGLRVQGLGCQELFSVRVFGGQGAGNSPEALDP